MQVQQNKTPGNSAKSHPSDKNKNVRWMGHSFIPRGSATSVGRLKEIWYNCYTVRFDFDRRKSLQLLEKRGIDFGEAQEIFVHPYYQDRRSEIPEQFRAVGWVGERLFTLIYEIREDQEGEFYHLVALWISTREEEKLYAQNS